MTVTKQQIANITRRYALKSNNSSASSLPASLTTKPRTSSGSDMLTPSEIALLKQKAKEGGAYAQKAFQDIKKK